MRTVGRIAFIALVPLFLVWALLAAQVLTSRQAARVTAIRPPASIIEESAAISPDTAAESADQGQPAAESETDLYGNEVSDAVAEYGLDATGSLYEMHAPQVELPHLPSPKS